MSTTAYSEINLHFTWHVKSNLPTISAEIESGLYRFIRNYALKTTGLIFHEIGGIETHVHLAVTIPPTLLISEWIRTGQRRELSLRQSSTRESENPRLADGLWRGEFRHEGSGMGGKLHTQSEGASQKGNYR